MPESHLLNLAIVRADNYKSRFCAKDRDWALPVKFKEYFV